MQLLCVSISDMARYGSSLAKLLHALGPANAMPIPVQAELQKLKEQLGRAEAAAARHASVKALAEEKSAFSPRDDTRCHQRFDLLRAEPEFAQQLAAVLANPRCCAEHGLAAPVQRDR